MALIDFECWMLGQENYGQKDFMDFEQKVTETTEDRGQRAEWLVPE